MADELSLKLIANWSFR